MVRSCGLAKIRLAMDVYANDLDVHGLEYEWLLDSLRIYRSDWASVSGKQSSVRMPRLTLTS